MNYEEERILRIYTADLPKETLGDVQYVGRRNRPSINDACDLERMYNGRNEHQAYLMGWICNCINNARLGVGDFIEIKDKEE